MKRVHNIDSIRGLTIISMVFYHLFYDLVYIFGLDIEFYRLDKVWPWQLSIAGSFFIISGISAYLTSRKKLIKRGIILSFLGLLLSLVTYLFLREEVIIFGVLNGLGLCMLFCGLLKDKISELPHKFAIVFLILFIVFYRISSGYINLFFSRVYLPKFLYNLNLFFLGFPADKFYSSDYFPFLPWIFIYLFGFFLGKFLKERNFYNKYGKENILSKIGKKSLVIYLSHQVIIFGVLYLIFNFIY